MPFFVQEFRSTRGIKTCPNRRNFVLRLRVDRPFDHCSKRWRDIRGRLSGLEPKLKKMYGFLDQSPTEIWSYFRFKFFGPSQTTISLHVLIHFRCRLVLLSALLFPIDLTDQNSGGWHTRRIRSRDPQVAIFLTLWAVTKRTANPFSTCQNLAV